MMFITRQAAMNEPMLTVAQERAAVREWQKAGDRAALELLVRSHARQVYAQAARWADNPSHLDDLVAEGMIGLMRAADKFDLKQDVRFSTYSAWWVLNGVAAALVRIKSVIDIPVRTFLDATGGRLGEEEQQLAQLALYGTVDLESGGELDGGFSSLVLNPEEAASANSTEDAQRRLLSQALSRLEPRDADIIQRLSLNDPPESVEDLAREFGTSRDRVRQLEKRAMQRLRQRLIEDGFHLEALT